LKRAITEGLRQRYRAKGRNLTSLKAYEMAIGMPKYNIQRPTIPPDLIEKVMTTLTGITTKHIASKNASGKVSRGVGNIRETLKNLKRNYNRLR